MNHVGIESRKPVPRSLPLRYVVAGDHMLDREREFLSSDVRILSQKQRKVFGFHRAPSGLTLPAPEIRGKYSRAEKHVPLIRLRLRFRRCQLEIIHAANNSFT